MNTDLEFVQSHIKLHLDISAYSLAIQCLKINDAILADGNGSFVSNDLKSELVQLLSIELGRLESELKAKNAPN